jgi:hypothetical protein
MADYSQIIHEAQKAYGLPDGVLQRLVGVESSGNPKAVSKKGATGLGQLMPETAKELGVTDPTDPVQNIHGAAKYLRNNLDKFSGDLGQALAGYNAGPNHPAVVKKDWRMLPKETKNYVGKFMDFIVPPANASEVPYKAPTEHKPSAQHSQATPTDQIVWDDEPKAAQHVTASVAHNDQIVWDEPTETVDTKNVPEKTTLDNIKQWGKEQLDFGHGKSVDQVKQDIKANWTPEEANKNITIAISSMTPVSMFSTLPKAIVTGALIGGSQGDQQDKVRNTVLGAVGGAGGKLVESSFKALTPALQNSKLVGKANSTIEGVLPSNWKSRIDTVGLNAETRLGQIQTQTKNLAKQDYLAPNQANMNANLQRLFTNPNQPEPTVLLGNTKRAIDDLVGNRSMGISRVANADAKVELNALAQGTKGDTSFTDAMNTYRGVNEKIRSLKAGGQDAAHWVDIKKSLEQDINNYGSFNGRQDVTDAWLTAKQNYSKLHAFDDLKLLYDKAHKEIGGETRFDAKAFANSAKSWSFENSNFVPQETKDAILQFSKDVSNNKSGVKFGKGTDQSLLKNAGELITKVGVPLGVAHYLYKHTTGE